MIVVLVPAVAAVALWVLWPLFQPSPSPQTVGPPGEQTAGSGGGIWRPSTVAGSEPATATTTTSVASTSLAPPGDVPPEEVHAETTTSDTALHTAEMLEVGTVSISGWPDPPMSALAGLVEAVEARLVAELTGVGRDAWAVTWRSAPCCAWARLRALTADFTLAPDEVVVVIEWETDRGIGSGPTVWAATREGRWVPIAERGVVTPL